MAVPKGNKNTKKDTLSEKTARLHITCSPEKKAALIKKARRQGLKLGDYILSKL